MAAISLKVVYILPSRYDDDGYPLRYWRGVLPSNTLCVLKTLTEAVGRSGALGADVALSVETYDDTVQAVPLRKIIRAHRRDRERVLVGFVGAQSNQFPRATDLALRLRAAGVPVMIGGFHVSGVMALFDEPTAELQTLLNHGVTLVRGEAEAPGFLEGILRDAVAGEMKPVYGGGEPPSIECAPVPQPDAEYLRHFVFSDMGTIDTSRGCPFGCSFCTIINVQGRTMRARSAECILKSIEANAVRGITFYFFTDDNFARSPIWEPLLDGLIALRRRGVDARFMMQVDTQAHRIPGFIQKASAAGCYLVFIGVETINPDNVKATGKAQNQVEDFADMVAQWRAVDICVHAAYIIGLPHDTPEGVRRNVATLRDDLKVDMATFFMMTPLPGSLDHKRMLKKRVPIDADLNNLDSFHETFRHAHFKPGEWKQAYFDAWEAMYSKDHIITALLRTPAKRYWKMFVTYIWYRYSTLAQTHPMVTGVFRLKERATRRPTFARENVFRYAWRRAKDLAWGVKTYAQIFFEFQEIWMLTRNPEDPRWKAYAELRVKCADMQRRVMESDLAGRCDVAMNEVRAMLATSAERMRSLSQDSLLQSRRLRHRLSEKATEIETRLRALDVQMPTWTQVISARDYAAQGLMGWFETMAIRNVAHRRRLNALRSDLAQRFRTGRIWGINVMELPGAVCFEVFMGLRFGLAFLNGPK